MAGEGGGEPSFAGQVDVQYGGQGRFFEAYMEVGDGEIKLSAGSVGELGGATSTAPVTTELSVAEPKSARKARPHCFRVSLSCFDDHGVKKYIIDPGTAERKSEMMATLNRMRHLAPPLGAGEEDQAFPNMVFVPIRVKHPVVPAREFTMYLLLLASFMYLLRQIFLLTLSPFRSRNICPGAGTV